MRRDEGARAWSLGGSLQGRCGVLGSMPTHAAESDRWGPGLSVFMGDRLMMSAPIHALEAAQGLMHSGC